MTKVSLKKISDTKSKAQAIVLFAHESDKSWTVPGADKSQATQLKSLADDGIEFSDLKKGLVLRMHEYKGFANTAIVAVPKASIEDIRSAAAAAYQLMAANKFSHFALDFDSLAKATKKSDEAAEAVTEGVLLSAYSFDDHKEKPKKKSFAVSQVDLVSSKAPTAAVSNAVKEGIALSESVNFTRWLGDQPGNKMTPPLLAKAAQDEAKGIAKLKVTVWDKARIKKEKMGGLYGVNLGGGPDCRFIIMEYKGAAASKKPVCFVGKGLTFDCGGISIKPSKGMEEMKYDMQGGATVIGTMLAIARLKLKVNAIAFVPSTENMPGPFANKPGDILTARNGKTVEVDNTDAEGRLILMDALAYASEKKPAVIFDAATLTGAVIVALGNSYTGVFTRNNKLMGKIQKAADTTGEWVWSMPINDHHVADMKGTYADLSNISSFAGAGSSTAAAFLEQFVDKDIPWAHFDIAGTAWNVGNRINYCPKKGASGSMVRTFVELAKNYS